MREVFPLVSGPPKTESRARNGRATLFWHSQFLGGVGGRGGCRIDYTPVVELYPAVSRKGAVIKSRGESCACRGSAPGASVVGGSAGESGGGILEAALEIGKGELVADDDEDRDKEDESDGSVALGEHGKGEE